MRRTAWIVATLAALGFLGLLLRPSRLLVETGPVMAGPLAVTVDEEGRTRVRERYVVSAPVTGRVARVPSREGDIVVRGAVLARMAAAPLDPRGRQEAVGQVESARDAARAAQAAVVRSQGTLDQARRERARVQQLAAQGIATPEDLERAQLAETSAARNHEAEDFTAQAAAHTIEIAEAALVAGDPERTADGRVIEIRSPIAGRILRIPERSERVVAAGTPLIEIGDPSGIEIVAEILSSDAVRVRAGDRVSIEDWGGESPLAGWVRTIEPSGFTKLSALGVEEQRVRVIVDPADRAAALGDGFRVEVRIVVWEAAHLLKVPVGALFRRGTEWSVFTVSGGRASERRVRIGHRNAFEAEVVSGLGAGDVVVLHPGDKLADGVRVKT